jgi:hypothetical protein
MRRYNADNIMDRELKHPNHSDALQSSNNPVNQHECINTSVNQFNNLDLNEPFYCTIKEFIKVCPSLRRSTIKRHIRQEIIEARRVRCPQSRGYRYEIAVYNSVVKKKVLKLRQEKEQRKQEKEQRKRRIQGKREIVKLKKIIKHLYTDIDENNIKEYIISFL